MIWEQNSLAIVMLTNLIESGSIKCDMYWPEEGASDYGAIKIELENVEEGDIYKIRKFKVSHAQEVGERTVYQYHFAVWPDHGVPKDASQLLQFIKKTSSSKSTHAGPTVVHCSAGVGRTGSYIVLHEMLRQNREKSVVNIPEYLRHIRGQRDKLVHTIDQYIFIHDALVGTIASQGAS